MSDDAKRAAWSGLELAAADHMQSHSKETAQRLSDAAKAWAAAQQPSRPAASGGLVFPPYGRSKGLPVAGASRNDLEFYANGCRRTLADESKARWHDKERALLAAIEAELAKQGGGDDAAF